MRGAIPDHYQALGVPSTATGEQIKAAFKRKALQYHPDKNPGNPNAEEQFKAINHAYQVLGDPEARARHDQAVAAYYQSQMAIHTPSARATPPPHAQQNPYGAYDWRKQPQYARPKRYKVDRDYYRQQLATLAVVAAVAGLLVLAVRLNDYLDNVKEERQAAAQAERIAKAYKQFNSGQYRPALDSVMALIADYPQAFYIRDVRKRMVRKLEKMADRHMYGQRHEQAARMYSVAIAYQRRKKLACFEKIASCYKALCMYEKAVAALDYVLTRKPANISMNLEIGDLLFDYLHDPAEAIKYYNQGKAVFKRYQSALYGNAYELLMSPEDAPQLYYELFIRRAKANSQLQNYGEAVKDYNWAIFFKPGQAGLHMARARCYLALGEVAWACPDWRAAIRLGNGNARDALRRYCR